MMGGLGPCGRSICCGSFLGDFQPVSIKMAKEQNLSLNPTKISGVCGRLMCCLKYEQDHYEQTRKSMPRLGKEVETPEGLGTVVDINVLKEALTVRLRRGDTSEQKTFSLADVKWHRPAPQSGEPTQRARHSLRHPENVAEAIQSDPEGMDIAADFQEELLEIADADEQEDVLIQDTEDEDLMEESDDDWRHAVEEALNRVEKREQ